MMWYTYRMDAVLSDIVDKDVAALQTAEALENALMNQKGFVSYYLIDGNPEWLERLAEYRHGFEEALKAVGRLARTATDRETVNRIASKYAEYIKGKDQVIVLYKTGEREAGARLHEKVRNHFFEILELCEGYKDVHNQRIGHNRLTMHTRAKQLRYIAGTAIWTVILLGLLLGFLLVAQVLNPLRQLVLGAGDTTGSEGTRDEVRAVSSRVHTLLEDVDQTKTRLAQSQEHLVQSEKLALLGKLAAGVAHSVRNPLTSVKMRLFSLGRSLDLSAPQKEDFNVISEEIRHIDNIVQNFLEFSRPPKLKTQRVSPSDVVDMALQLLKHRLELYNADVQIERPQRLPEILADPEELKEVLVNLLVNACEAMGSGGRIVICEQEGLEPPLGRAVVIRVSDNGPGIPEAIQDRVFEPFFSTREEGTGLGLSIASRIIEEHGGLLNLSSEEGKGASFTITLPC